jgi:uncharacterized protein YjbI with pentapeptide repeats
MSYGLTKHTNPEIAALEAQWWKDWYAQDFSWEGLKAKTFGSVTLASIWHDEEPFLITEPGTNRRWTRLHCPYRFADGSPSPKAGWGDAEWQAIEDIILATAYEPDAYGNLWLSGVVLRASEIFGELPQAIRLRLDWAHVHQLFFLSRSFPLLDAAHTWFDDNVVAMDAVFNDADFSQATFCGHTLFERARFDGATSFAGAKFLSVAEFTFAQFTARTSVADFSKAVFCDRAEFSEVHFAHEAVFNSAQFAGRVNFYATAFEDRALFDDIQCLENIHFYKAAFVRRLTMSRSIFYRKLNLEGITDGDPIALSPQPLELTAMVTDDKPVALMGELKPSTGPTTQSYRALPKLIANDAVFHYDANFCNRDLLSPSTFENARFCHHARFHGSDMHPNVSFHNTRLQDALAFRPTRIVTPPEALLRLRFMSQPTQTDYAVWKKAFLKTRLEIHKGEFTYNGYYDGLEASYRTLKQNMEDRRDRIREGEYFMYELRARRKRHDVPFWETAASWAYWAASDYGNSIVRPLIMMLLLFIGLGFGYFALAEKELFAGPLSLPLSADQSSRLIHAFGFSWGNIFSPFNALDAGKVSEADPWTSAMLNAKDAGFSLKIKVIATVQSLLSLTLAFLAGLAGRRRFQIN